MRNVKMAEAAVVQYTPEWYVWNGLIYMFAVVGIIDTLTGGWLWQ